MASPVRLLLDAARTRSVRENDYSRIKALYDYAGARERGRERKSGGTAPKVDLSVRLQKWRILRCVLGWRGAKSCSCGRTRNVLEVCGETPQMLMGSNGTPIESIGCGGKPKTVASTVGRQKETEGTERRQLCAGVAGEAWEDKSWKDKTRRQYRRVEDGCKF